MLHAGIFATADVAEFTLYRRVGMSKMFLACSSTVYNYVEPEIWVSFVEDSF
jgi:hypothetical protein